MIGALLPMAAKGGVKSAGLGSIGIGPIPMFSNIGSHIADATGMANVASEVKADIKHLEEIYDKFKADVEETKRELVI